MWQSNLSGRLAQISGAQNSTSLSNAYQWLSDTVEMLSDFQVLQYDETATQIYQTCKSQKVRIGTQDLRIASIVLAQGGILLTRNLQDFAKVPGLQIQDWSV
jgi:tRNA(fMet)-specific endonuclease VapC